MVNKIVECLKKLEISEYLINDIQQESVELFFIRKKLDIRRRKDVKNINVLVYRDFEKDGKKKKGVSSVRIYPTMTETEISNALSGAYLAASYVCNPYYEIPKGNAGELITMDSTLNASSLEDNALKMTEALFAEDNFTDVFLNSAELFIYETTTHIVNFNGTDVSYKKRHVSGEFVVQCPQPQDVETYQDFKYDELETQALRDKVKRALEMTRARAQATTAPTAGKYRVIISGQYMSTMFDYYMSRSSSSMIYPKYSGYEIGTKVQGENVTGDKLTMTLKAKVPYSGEGTPMKDRSLLREGTLETIHGGIRFGYYLGIEPTGNYDSIKVEPGSVSFEDMKKQPYLHIVNFSDFQMDDFSGYFGGEIRLAFLYDGEKVTPVTGGSINGCLLEVQDKLCLSSDMEIEDGYEGPFAICIDDISVAGD